MNYEIYYNINPLISSGKVGKPRLETRDEMKGLAEAIMTIIIPNSAADDRRRSEVYNCCQTLVGLQKKLEEMGYNLSKSPLYYR